MEVNTGTKPAGLGIRVLAAILDCAVVLVAQYFVVGKWGEVGPEGEMVLKGAPVFLLLFASAAF